MEQYTATAMSISRLLTRQFSTSFSSASRLFPVAVESHIYNIYGLVRIADEIVDTYVGDEQAVQLLALESETNDAIRRGFSANPIVHSFAFTARTFAIGSPLIAPFFASMHMDINRLRYDRSGYEQYIYGSAEVVGLMCLKVFCRDDPKLYNQLEKGARYLGSAYQKINFLRDLAADYNQLGRFYFPSMDFATFDNDAKTRVEADIAEDLAIAWPYVQRLPSGVRPAVKMSYLYYHRLFIRLQMASAETIKHQRIRVPTYEKFALLARHKLRIA